MSERRESDPVPANDDTSESTGVESTDGVVGEGDHGCTEEEEFGGPPGPEPTRYGDWERKGRCIDF